MAALVHRQIHNTNYIMCSEIFRNYQVSENILLAMTLFAISTYCDKYIKLEGLLESERFDIAIKELKAIRFLRVSPSLFQNPQGNSSRCTGASPRCRLQRIWIGKSPKYYSRLIELYRTWRNYVFISIMDAKNSKCMQTFEFASQFRSERNHA